MQSSAHVDVYGSPYADQLLRHWLLAHGTGKLNSPTETMQHDENER